MTAPTHRELTLLEARPLLGSNTPLPVDVPFTAANALAAGVSRRALQKLTKEALIRRVLKGVYVAAQVPDSLWLRAQALRLVVPPGAVVTDWTACWLHTGLLPPGDHLRVPPVSMFRAEGRGRLRNSLCKSGERTLLPTDLTEVDGLRVTVPLRTAWDLGRLCHRDVAIGALDALLRDGSFSRLELIGGVERFRRQRGVVQLRALAAIADPRAESPSESVLRLRWIDNEDLPKPTPQVAVRDNWGKEIFRIDLGVPEIRFGAEYDGERWHSTQEAIDHDRRRRAWLEDAEGWTIRVLKRDDVYGPNEDVARILHEGITAARRRMGEFRGPDAS
jgi:hypothetical protein